MVTLAGWLVLSNHCALGRLAPGAAVKAVKPHECCHNGASQPAKKPVDGSEGMQCCKSLHALVPVDAKVPAASLLEICALPAEWAVLEMAQPELCPAAPATGPPPRAASFSELVLHRSLRSHAPPFLA